MCTQGATELHEESRRLCNSMTAHERGEGLDA
jgi:hypothetical protein